MLSISKVKDQTWAILREEGAIVEEFADEDEDTEEEGGGPQSFDEKQGLAEKIMLQVSPVDSVTGANGGEFKAAQTAPGSDADLDIDDLR